MKLASQTYDWQTPDANGDTGLHRAAELHGLQGVPALMLNARDLGTPNHEGIAPIHWIAAKGLLPKIPAFVAFALINLPNRRGETPFQWALKFGHADQVPLGCYAAKSVQQPDKAGLTAYHYMAGNGQLNFLPGALRSREVMRREDQAGMNPTHYAARFGFVKDVPPEMWDPGMLIQPNKEGVTPLHEACSAGNADKLPPGSLTRERLKLRDQTRWTPMHGIMAQESTKPMLNPDLITKELLLLADAHGVTPLSLALEKGNLNFIPQEVLMDLADCAEIQEFTQLKEDLADQLAILRQQQEEQARIQAQMREEQLLQTLESMA